MSPGPLPRFCVSRVGLGMRLAEQWGRPGIIRQVNGGYEVDVRGGGHSQFNCPVSVRHPVDVLQH